MMTIKIAFEAEGWVDFIEQVYAFIGDGPIGLPKDPEARGVLAAPAPEPVKPKKSRARALPTPAEMIAATAPPTAPEPELEPEPEPGPPMPTLDALKALVTQAVRGAQKKEGPGKILELLPAFKAKTGLDFVMNAKEEHRPALNALVVEAGL
jgi:hypothetical protein